MPILAAHPSCLCRPEIFCPFRTQTFFPEPCALYECVYSRVKGGHFGRLENNFIIVLAFRTVLFDTGVHGGYTDF